MLAIAFEEITIAFHGGDWGFSALADVLGSAPLAHALVNFAAALGEVL